MILYSVNYRGPLSNHEWSIVSIHKTLEGSEKARNQYISNNLELHDSLDCEYCIVEINTDTYEDCIFNYDEIEEGCYNCYYKEDSEYDELEDDEDD